MVDSLYYTGDMITSTGSCTKTLTGHGRTDWTKFKELLSLLTSETISLWNQGKVFVAYLWSTLFMVGSVGLSGKMIC